LDIKPEGCVIPREWLDAVNEKWRDRSGKYDNHYQVQLCSGRVAGHGATFNVMRGYEGNLEPSVRFIDAVMKEERNRIHREEGSGDNLDNILRHMAEDD
jgi:hypothetical protein